MRQQRGLSLVNLIVGLAVTGFLVVMAAKVSYLAGPQVVDGCPASGPTQPA